MTYTPTNWQTGDIVTAEKLNKLEDGVNKASASNVLFANETYDETNNWGVLDRTWNDIKNAIDTGKMVYIVRNDSTNDFVNINYSSVVLVSANGPTAYTIQYSLYAHDGSGYLQMYSATSADDYLIVNYN